MINFDFLSGQVPHLSPCGRFSMRYKIVRLFSQLSILLLVHNSPPITKQTKYFFRSQWNWWQC